MNFRCPNVSCHLTCRWCFPDCDFFFQSSFCVWKSLDRVCLTQDNSVITVVRIVECRIRSCEIISFCIFVILNLRIGSLLNQWVGVLGLVYRTIYGISTCFTEINAVCIPCNSHIGSRTITVICCNGFWKFYVFPALYSYIFDFTDSCISYFCEFVNNLIIFCLCNTDYIACYSTIRNCLDSFGCLCCIIVCLWCFQCCKIFCQVRIFCSVACPVHTVCAGFWIICDLWW